MDSEPLRTELQSTLNKVFIGQIVFLILDRKDLENVTGTWGMILLVSTKLLFIMTSNGLYHHLVEIIGDVYHAL